MSLSSEALFAALKSASSSAASASSTAYDTDEVVMKLAKKSNQALLSFEINGSTRGGRRVRVSHDVKIEVMRPSEVQKLAEPLCPEPDVRHCFYFSNFCSHSFIPVTCQIHILLPPLHKLRTVVDRLRIMSDVLGVRANYNGCLRLSINTETVKVDTEWKNCTIPSS
jgi:HUS1 checkpoint protein